jgi:transposase
MPRPLAIDLRQRVVKAYESSNETLAQVAGRFGVGEASVNRWVSRNRKTGTVAPLPHAGGPDPMIDAKGRELMKALVDQKPDATREELARAYRDATGVSVSVATVGRTVWRLGYTLKKRPFTRRSVRPRG